MRTFLLVLAVAFATALPAFAARNMQNENQDPKNEIPADTEIKTTKSGLKYSVLVPGNDDGKSPSFGSTVKVHYTGWLTDGKKFDSSVDRGQPAEFKLGQVIEGWNEGLELMKVGSKFKFTIPWPLAYGERGNGRIPPKADLIFVVELLDVTPGPAIPAFVAPNAEKQKKTASGLAYEVIAEGEGDNLAKADGISMRYTFWNQSGQVIETSLLGPSEGGTIKVPVSRMQIPCLAEGLLLMKKGSRFLFEVQPELAFKAQDRGSRCPPNSVTIWLIEIVDVMKVPTFVAPNPEKSKTTASGLIYEVVKEGEGRSPSTADMCSVHYSGWLEDGTNFDSSYSRGEPTQFRPDQVIKGWTEALLLMKPGTIFRVKIPAALAYGENPPPGSNIPPNSILIFQMELVKVGP